MGKQDGRDRDVVVDDLGLGVAGERVENLVEVAEIELPIAYSGADLRGGHAVILAHGRKHPDVGIGRWRRALGRSIAQTPQRALD